MGVGCMQSELHKDNMQKLDSMTWYIVYLIYFQSTDQVSASESTLKTSTDLLQIESQKPSQALNL